MFNIGDTIKVKNSKRYATTTGDWQGKVIAIISEKKILAYGMLDHKFYTLDVKDLEPVAEKPIVTFVQKNVKPPKELKWEVGARVKLINKTDWFTDNINNGDLGTIKHIDDDDNFVIEFDEFFGGHDGCGVGKDGHCWNCYNSHKICFELIDDNRNTDFQAGEWVRIRDWEDMEREYGLINDRINCRYSFTTSMKYLCGMYVKIEAIEDKTVIFDREATKAYLLRHWSFSTDMIEKLPELKVGDKVRFRTVEELSNNFYVAENGDIHTSELYMFNGSMQEVCGKEYTITSVKNIRAGYQYISIMDSRYDFTFNNLMVEKVE